VQFQKNIYTPPAPSTHHRRIGILRGWEFLQDQKFKELYKLNWNFQIGPFYGEGGGGTEKYLPWGKYGYFLELHTQKKKVVKIITVYCRKQKQYAM